MKDRFLTGAREQRQITAKSNPPRYSGFQVDIVDFKLILWILHRYCGFQIDIVDFKSTYHGYCGIHRLCHNLELVQILQMLIIFTNLDIYPVWETELTKLTMASLFHLDVVLISVHAKWKLWKFLFISQIEFRLSKKIIAMQPDLLLYPAIPQQWTIEQQSVKHCASSSCAFLRSVSA